VGVDKAGQKNAIGRIDHHGIGDWAEIGSYRCDAAIFHEKIALGEIAELSIHRQDRPTLEEKTGSGL
jgi:hypothetical protein